MIKGISKEDLEQALSKIDKDVSPQVREAVEKAVRGFAEEGRLPAETLNISEENIETLYGYTYQQFKSGKYKQALDSFGFLTTLEPSYRNFFGLAACHQYLGNHLLAIGNYMVCTQLDMLNPVPHFHLYGCYRKLNQDLPALQSLEMTIALAKENPAFTLLQQRAELERDGFKNEIEQRLKNKGAQ